MASITQTIPQYSLGMSEQPDQLKFPGQVTEVTNAIPDITKGLFKRPGAKRIGANALSSVQSGGSWFHYFRDESEGSYIGQVAQDGTVRVWSCKTGTLMTTIYGDVSHPIDEAYVKNYLTTSSPENLQFLTINDTTFVTNRDTTNANTLIGTTGTTDATPHPHFAFIEILRTENGRQYGVNIHGNNTEVTTLRRATAIKVAGHSIHEGDGTGHCPAIGTEVFEATNPPAGTNYSAASNIHHIQQAGQTVIVGKKNLVFRVTQLGQQGVSPNYSANQNGPGGNNYRCSYNVESNLLHGGEGWHEGDAIRVLPESAVGTDASGNDAFVDIIVTDTEETQLNATVNIIEPTFTGDVTSGSNVITNIQNFSSGHTIDDLKPGSVITQPTVSGVANTLGSGTITVLKVLSTTSISVSGANFIATGTGVGYKAKVTGDGLIRPAATPFDADTAVTADTIIGGILDEINAINGITAEHIGTGIYVYSNSQFNLDVVEDDLMRCFQSSVNDVQNLPNQCKHGYIVKVANSRRSDEDDYYLRFEGQNGKDGVGSWVECAQPGIPKTLTNMPLVIQRVSLTSFRVKQFTYADREVGDDNTNGLPSFVGQRINKVLFFRNRLVFLSGENVITSRPGTLGIPDFFNETALTVSASDPVDISAASTFPSELFDGIETNTGLVVFSSNQQFLLASDDTVFNPDTAKLRSISTFNYNQTIAPISLGTTVAYVDNSNKFSRFNEMANIQREGEPSIVEVSKVVPTLLPNDIDLLTNSRENSIVLLGKTGSDDVFGYKYFQVSEQRQQAAWFKWKLNNPLIYHFIINDEYFFLDSDYYLQSIKLVQADTDPSIVQDNVDFLLHVDNHTTVSGGSFDSATNTTTFSNVGWLNTVTTPNHKLVIIDTDTNSDRVGRYAREGDTGGITVSGTSFTVTGEWTDSYVIGYVYPYEVKFPTFYPTRQQGNASRADINSSLVLHRLKFHFGKIGLYETTLERLGKNDYTEVYESTELDAYDVSDAPYLEEFIKTVPVYEKNTNVDVTLRSSHPAPATLRAVSWEGDYTPKFYKRV